jgi:hypothetical protein
LMMHTNRNSLTALLREWCPGLQSWFRLIHEEINTMNNVTVRIKISVFDHQCPKTCWIICVFSISINDNFNCSLLFPCVCYNSVASLDYLNRTNCDIVYCLVFPVLLLF